VVEPGSAPGDWAVISGMYETHLKYRQMSPSIDFNNIRPRLARVVSVVWDASTAGDNWYSLT